MVLVLVLMVLFLALSLVFNSLSLALRSERKGSSRNARASFICGLKYVLSWRNYTVVGRSTWRFWTKIFFHSAKKL